MKETYLFHPFLIDPKYRVWRYLFFGIIGAITTFNLMFLAFQDVSRALGNRIYLVCLFSFAVFSLALILNYRYLVPKFLLKGRIAVYLILLTVVVFLLPTISVWTEYVVRNALDLPHRITSYTNPLILVDNLASCLMIAICVLGTSVIAILQEWISRKEQVGLMEYEHHQSEINKLKGQVTPAFLSKTLSNASTLVKTNPGKATEMLMKLGQLLRYQLYDCNRDKVLLRSEISFLDNFLRIEQMNREEFTYEIRTEGDLNNLFVSPLLFVSVIQDMTGDSASMELDFSVRNGSLLFQCKSDSRKEPDGEEIRLLQKRLAFLYKEKQTLVLQTGLAVLTLEITE